MTDLQTCPPRESRVLHLHTDQTGKLWMLAGDDLPQTVELVTALDKAKMSDAVRVVGMGRNAALLRQLYLWHCRGKLPRLAVGTPLIGLTRRERDTPSVLLRRMREFPNGLPASVGGWHTFTATDESMYALVEAVRTDQSYEQQCALLMRHPAWPALSFLKVDPKATCRVLAAIGDPRWFVDRRHPERAAKLRAFLGLREATIKQVLAGEVITAIQGRCQDVMRAWMSFGPLAREAHVPGRYLWRQWIAADTPNAVRAQRVTQAFVTYMRWTWLDAIQRCDRKSNTGELFDARQFFGDDPDLAAFLTSQHDQFASQNGGD